MVGCPRYNLRAMLIHSAGRARSGYGSRLDLEATLRARFRTAIGLTGLLAVVFLGGASCRRNAAPRVAPAASIDPASGLGVEDLIVGSGDAAAFGKRVSVHFTGWLNGAKFDTSLNRLPMTFRLGVGDVLRGWDLGIIGMKVGGKRKLTLPPALGYGHKGSPGGAIPPDSVLVFEIELLSAADG